MKFLERYRTVVIGFLVITIVFGLFLIYRQPVSTGEEKISKHVIVDISGGVKKPGVYNFENSSRVIDAINKAGGVTKKADLEKIALEVNQAALLEDEQKIYIPLKKTSKKNIGQEVDGPMVASEGVVNINQASAKQLESLPGVGPVYAQRIVDYRSKIGRFNSPEQLLEISGIGPRTLEKIASQISF